MARTKAAETVAETAVAGAESGAGAESTAGAESVTQAVTAARVGARERQIIDAATHLMHEHGSTSVSMKAVASSAGISVGLLYKYFDSKESIVLAAVRRVLGAFREEVPAAITAAKAADGDPVAHVVAGFAQFCRCVDEHRAAVVLTYRESRALSLSALTEVKNEEIATLQPLVDAVNEAREQGALMTDNAELFAHDLLLFAHAWGLKHWFYTDRGIDLQNYIEHQTQVLIAPAVVHG